MTCRNSGSFNLPKLNCFFSSVSRLFSYFQMNRSRSFLADYLRAPTYVFRKAHISIAMVSTAVVLFSIICRELPRTTSFCFPSVLFFTGYTSGYILGGTNENEHLAPHGYLQLSNVGNGVPTLIHERDVRWMSCRLLQYTMTGSLREDRWINDARLFLILGLQMGLGRLRVSDFIHCTSNDKNWWTLHQLQT